MKLSRIVWLAVALVVSTGCAASAPRAASRPVASDDGSSRRAERAPPPACDSLCNGTAARCEREVPVTPPAGWYERGGAPLQNAREPCDPRCCASAADR